jgi:DNA-binding transcriptional ArsR family regulator
MTRRPPHVPTPETRAAVASMLADGLTIARIGQTLGVDLRALRRLYRAELDAAGRRQAAPHVPTNELRQKVWLLAACGVTGERIASALGMRQPVLSKHYRQELDNGLTEANGAVAKSLYKLATTAGPSQAASCMFWLKTRGKWQEVHKTEVSGAGGGQLIIYSGVLAQHDRDI